MKSALFTVSALQPTSDWISISDLQLLSIFRSFNKAIFITRANLAQIGTRVVLLGFDSFSAHSPYNLAKFNCYTIIWQFNLEKIVFFFFDFILGQVYFFNVVAYHFCAGNITKQKCNNNDCFQTKEVYNT